MKTERVFWRDLGIMFFSGECETGQLFGFVSPLREFTLETPTVPVVVAGKFRGYNALRDPIEWPALPTKTEGGIAFPGLHRLEALEDGSIYACVCELPANLTEVTPDMYKLDHTHVTRELVTYQYNEGYRAVIVMSGNVVVNGEVAFPGSRFDLPEGGTLIVDVLEPAHIVGYRLTVQTGGA